MCVCVCVFMIESVVETLRSLCACFCGFYFYKFSHDKFCLNWVSVAGGPACAEHHVEFHRHRGVS